MFHCWPEVPKWRHAPFASRLTLLASIAGLMGAFRLSLTVGSKKPSASRPAAPPEYLHVVATQRILGKHHNQTAHDAGTLETVRLVLDKALSEAGSTLESRDDLRMCEQLERDIGLSLTEIVELSKRWPT